MFLAYRESVINLARLTREERAHGQVFMLGDLNVGFVQDRRAHLYYLPYATFRRQGMRSMWATQRPSRDRGSQIHGHSLVDQVYSTHRATSARVRYDVLHGDHYPVIARYLVSTAPVPPTSEPTSEPPPVDAPPVDAPPVDPPPVDAPPVDPTSPAPLP